MIALVDDARSRARRQALGREALAHADGLYRLARYLTRDPAEAEDLVQETFARALHGAEAFEEQGHLKAWLFRILRNLHLDRRRRDGRLPLDREPALEAVAADAGPPGDAELEMLRRVVAGDVEAALRQLGEDARTVILLDLEDMTETEMADVLGCAVGTVKSRLSRARAVLRTALADYRGG